MTTQTFAWRLRCRVCNASADTNWTVMLARRVGPSCAECGSAEVTAQETGTGVSVAFPRPLVPPVEWWQCCNCGGGGLDSYGDTCPHCNGYGNC
ncbi:hypothetical protein SMC26_24195 [Actinomadura fulvescens]|uniref:Uncharacterized protein n=1 Tax=Actinomadura fulvescens TaxID=46160 RepID=A0ABN3Q3C9_9ACTN